MRDNDPPGARTSSLLENPPPCSHVHELREFRSAEQPLVGDRDSQEEESMERLRARYLSHLGHYPKLVQSYVPNIGPLLQPGAPLVPHLASPSAIGVDSERRPFFGPGGVKSSIVNVSAATLGAGSLALPHAFNEAGVVVSIVIMLFLFCLSTYSISLLVRAIEISGFSTYEELSLHYLGRRAAMFIEFNMIFFCFGTAVAYAIVVGSSAQAVLEVCGLCPHTSLPLMCNTAAPLSIITIVVLLPLSMLDELNELRFTSLVGVICILYLFSVVLVQFISHAAKHGLPHDIAWMPPSSERFGVIEMLSLAVFAFSCQPNVPGVYVELERRSFRRMTKVARGSMSLCLVIYVVMGVAGYLTFGGKTMDNILDNLRSKHVTVPVAIAFFAMTFAVVMSFPLNMFPVRYSLETLVLFRRPDWEPKRRLVRNVIIVSCVLLSLVFALIIPSINKVFSLIGAFSGSIICYIAPALFYGFGLEGPWLSRQKAGAVLMLVSGCFFLVAGTFVSLLNIFHHR